MGLKSIWTKLYQTLASVRTGIFLIIVVGIFSAAGTIILQRPTTEPDEMQRGYSPETLLWLDRLGLTDIYHSWWFLTLLCLFCLCLIFVSLDRWPNAWKVYSRPVRFAAPHFRLGLPQTAKLPITDEAAALSTTERVLGRFGFKAERATEDGATGLFAEKQRFSVLAVFVVHLSLLCIFAGYIVDGIVGYRGNINIPVGQTMGQITVSDNRGGETKKTLPFQIRCDNAGMEAYADGSPKKWWSDLVVIENGKEVLSKKIIVNDPLVYKGIRLYQSSMYPTKTPRAIILTATPKKGGDSVSIEVPFNGKASLPDGESLAVLHFIPEYYVMDNQVYKKSDELVKPAAQVALITAKGETKAFWACYQDKNCTDNAETADATYDFALTDLSMVESNVTGLEVSHHPGQAGIWIGVVLMALGLVIAFYTQHVRIWAAIADDGKGGKLLWVGGTTNKNRDKFKATFDQIKTALGEELGGGAAANPNQKNEDKTLSKA
jgi:cytochrome c biogenesis protein